MVLSDLEQVARRFPLVQRARPPCPPLETRIQEVRALSLDAREAGGEERLTQAAKAQNLAALIASDCGMPDLARSLCWRQFNLYMAALPLNARLAQYALEPIVNLVRLLLREGEGESAYRALLALHHAVRSRAAAEIDGRVLRFGGLTCSAPDHRSLCRWLWAVLLGEGTRALVNAGHWKQVLGHVERFGGVGQRLLDGRQAAIIGRCITGAPTASQALIEDSEISQPWEQAVAGCLTVLCLRAAGRPASESIASMVEGQQHIPAAPELAVFRTRVGLAVVDLADAAERPGISRMISQLVEATLATENGQAARDVLAHSGCESLITDGERRALTAVVSASRLGRGDIPERQLSELVAAVTRSEEVTSETLRQTCP